jgi:hypothetical protein
MFIIDIQDLEDMDGYQATQTVSDDMITEFRLMTIHDDAGEMLGVFAFCRDITMSVSSKDQEKEVQMKIDALHDEQRQYDEISTPPSVIPTSAKSPTHQTPTR